MSSFLVNLTTKDRTATQLASVNRLLLTQCLDCDLDIAGSLAAVDEVTRGRLLPLCYAADILAGIFRAQVLQLEQVHVDALFAHSHLTGGLPGDIIGAQIRHGTGAHHGHRWAAEDPRHREETLGDILRLNGAAKLQRLTGREGPSLRAHLDAEIPVWKKGKQMKTTRLKANKCTEISIKAARNRSAQCCFIFLVSWTCITQEKEVKKTEQWVVEVGFDVFRKAMGQ